MGIFDRLRDFVSSGVKTRSKKEGAHGNHWETVTELDSLEELVTDSVKDPDSIEEHEYGETVEVCIKGDENIKVCSVTVDGQILTSYPFVRGLEHEIDIEEVVEWSNGVEAQIRGGLEEAYVSFFDTRYFANKTGYEEGEHTFSVGALAYTLYEAEEEVIEDQEGGKMSTKGMAALFPLEEGDIDDYLFHGPVKKVGKTSFNGKEFYEIHTSIFRTTEDADIDTVVYASTSDDVSGDYVPKKGDDVAGVIWLQGYRPPK